MYKLINFIILRLQYMTALSAFILPLFWLFFFILEQPFASAQQPQQPTITISIVQGSSNPGKDHPFYPSPINLPLANLGVTVSWTNNDNVLHTVKSSNGLFDSGILAPTESFQWTFFNRGYYSYYCALHPYMTGILTIS